jgi:threonylcarbamoyladenosine tRNA methylthiotransferase MtaB
VLTGVHLGYWGHDFQPACALPDLISAILSETEVPRLRLSSLEPWDLQTGFFELWQDERLCRHLHLPLQSGSAATLRRMARKTTPEEFAALLEAARGAIPDLAVTTDVMVGFPGEDESEFAASLNFVRDMHFAGGHVFSYSARPGTAAASMAGQVPHPIRKIRNAAMRDALTASAEEFQVRFVGRKLPVLWESIHTLARQRWELHGLTDNYLRVSAQSSRHLWNQVTPVQLTQRTHEGLYGEILNA